MMRSSRYGRRVPVIAGAAAIIAMVGLTAGCGESEKKEEPTTSTTTSTTAPTVSPTEKSINPTGPNKFTPPVTAPPPPTAIPGDN